MLLDMHALVVSRESNARPVTRVSTPANPRRPQQMQEVSGRCAVVLCCRAVPREAVYSPFPYSCLQSVPVEYPALAACCVL
jgi:hypothetical protein